MTNFPLIARYLPGLEPRGGVLNEIVNAADLEAELEKGIKVNGCRFEHQGWSMGEGNYEPRTHEALLIGIQEIQPESAENLLRERLEALDARDQKSRMGISPQEREWCNRVSAFLARSRK